MKREKGKHGIVICGAYGLGNMGDEAILSAILCEMRQVAPEAEITVLTRSPRETAEKYGVKGVYTFNFPGIWRAMGRCQLYVNGGGSLIQDVTSRRSLWYYLHTLRVAKRRGCKVLMYGCGIGPVGHRSNIRRTRNTLNRCVDMITLRDQNSQETLVELGVTEPEVIIAADPTVILSAAPKEVTDGLLEGFGMDPEGNYICFTFRTWPGFEEKVKAFADAARYAWERYHLIPAFVPIEAKRDDAAAAMVTELLSDVPYFVLPQCDSPYHTIGLFARMRVVVSMRLHALVFAAGQGVPLVGVVYDQKVSSFLDYIGQDLYVDLANVSTAVLRENIDKAVARIDDREFLLHGVECLRQVEHRNSEAAERLLKGEKA